MYFPLNHPAAVLTINRYYIVLLCQHSHNIFLFYSLLYSTLLHQLHSIKLLIIMLFHTLPYYVHHEKNLHHYLLMHPAAQDDLPSHFLSFPPLFSPSHYMSISLHIHSNLSSPSPALPLIFFFIKYFFIPIKFLEFERKL